VNAGVAFFVSEDTMGKKYKTVAGYLRSCGERLQYGKLPEDKDQRIAAVQAGQRDIINSLLPQIGLAQHIEATEKPIDGITRLLAQGGTEQQVAALETCRRWLKNYVIVLGVTAIPQVKTAQGLVSYHVCGFRRGDHNSRVSVIVDAEELSGNAFAIAEKLAGPDYCFHASSNINELVPDGAKNKLFTSDEELYAVVPALNWRARTRRTSR
jgi:hypothetical protein